eukprot:gb/GECG01016818.1/.p1 GENE.gb/GECG01016818.1/~~gb/GECG01016818.1/.p1  ORF type:complete len:217 (+),score=27.93 gb/GECG01016818.1/:1-651(+)
MSSTNATSSAISLPASRAKRTLIFPQNVSNAHFPEEITNKDKDEFQVSVHTCSRALQRELKELFRDLSDEQLGQLKMITTCQRALVDLVEWGDNQAKEKDRLLEKFMWWAKQLQKQVKEDSLGHFVDIMDPCTGQPVHSSTNTVFAEIDGLQVALGYHITDIGNCKLLSHPHWGTSVYPASMFTTAPLQDIASCIEKVTGDKLEVVSQQQGEPTQS